MIKRTALLICMLIACQGYAQDTLSSKIKEPDFPFEPMYLDSNYSLVEVPLEKYDLDYTNGIGKAESFYKMKGEKSSLRLKKSTTIAFVVKQGLVNGSTTNVKDMYKIFKTTIKKQARFCSTVKYTSGQMHANSDDLPIKFKKVRDDIYMLILDSLDAGEYIIEAKVREVKLYSFAIE